MAALQGIHLMTSLSMATIIVILRFLVCLPRIPQCYHRRLNSAPTTSIGTRLSCQPSPTEEPAPAKEPLPVKLIQIQPPCLY